jgi:hypothetical protein
MARRMHRRAVFGLVSSDQTVDFSLSSGTEMR